MIAGGPRLLVLNGSPRPDGNSVRLARLFADLAGGAADFVHLYDEGPSACRACLVCADGSPCPLPDTSGRMDAIMRRLAAADCLVLASPLHFSSLTAPLVAFISRLQPWWLTGKRLEPSRERCGILLVSGGSRYENMFRPARSVAAAAFKVLGLRFVGMVGVADSDTTPVDGNAPALAEMKALAERVQSCFDGS